MVSAPDDEQALLTLASASPRRRELLRQLGLAHVVLPQAVDESGRRGESAAEYVTRVAAAKAAAAIADPARRKDLPVLAADTTVACDGAILGKPGDRESCLRMLGALSGRRHQVLTAVALAREGEQLQSLVVTEVSFRHITPDEMLAYWNSGEPRDKAGAYAVQGRGAMFVSRIEGSYSAVVGLPLFETMQLLARFGITAQRVLEAPSR